MPDITVNGLSAEPGCVLQRADTGEIYDIVTLSWQPAPSGSGAFDADFLLTVGQSGNMNSWIVTVPSGISEAWNILVYTSTTPNVDDQQIYIVPQTAALQQQEIADALKLAPTTGSPAAGSAMAKLNSLQPDAEIPDATAVYVARVDGKVKGRTTLVKTPQERLAIAVHFDQLLGTDEALASVSEIALESGDVASDAFTEVASAEIVGKSVVFAVTGGTDATTSQIRVHVTTTLIVDGAAAQYAPDILISVSDSP